MAEPYAEQLVSVRAAITAIESEGQAWGQGGRRLDRGNLATLYAREKELQTKIARQTRGGMRVRSGIYVP